MYLRAMHTLTKNGNGDNWDDVMDVDQATMDAYTTTDLVREDGNDKVYRLYAAEGTDTGNKYWLNMTASDFTAVFDADAIYTINGTEHSRIYSRFKCYKCKFNISTSWW